MRRLFLFIGWFFILLGIAALMTWFFGDPYRWVGRAAQGQISVMIAGGLLALVVLGILMVIGETDSRGR